MADDCMVLTHEAGLATLTLNDARRGNPFDLAFSGRLRDLVLGLEGDPAVRAVLIRATGRYFSVGGDIQKMIADPDGVPAFARRISADLHVAMTRLARMDAPVVVEVQGPAAGGAVGFLAQADFVLASEAASFTAAFPTIGFCADSGATVALPARMGHARARHFLMLSETLDARAALAAGLVDEVWSADELPGKARALARRLAEGPTRAYGAIRRTLARARVRELEAALEDEIAELAQLAATEDSREGIRAFAERRPPVFRGC